MGADTIEFSMEVDVCGESQTKLMLKTRKAALALDAGKTLKIITDKKAGAKKVSKKMGK